jgi:hypothetical protein
MELTKDSLWPLVTTPDACANSVVRGSDCLDAYHDTFPDGDPSTFITDFPIDRRKHYVENSPYQSLEIIPADKDKGDDLCVDTRK